MESRFTRCLSLFILAFGFVSVACAPDPSLNDPYEENGYFWPYEAEESGPEVSACDQEPGAPLGMLEGGVPILAMTNCEAAPEGDFPICARFNELGELQVAWDGANGFAVFVTEPQAIVPAAPNTPVSEGETFWSIGPIAFPTGGFSSPLTYQNLPEGMEDVSVDHRGPQGGLTLTSGRCYKITIINKSFRRASVIVGWQ